MIIRFVQYTMTDVIKSIANQVEHTRGCLFSYNEQQ